MKKNLFLLVSIMFLALLGCSEDDKMYVKKENSSQNLKGGTATSQERDIPRTIKSDDQIVVRYTKAFTATQKKSIRNRWYVKKYKKCSCGDANLELWDINKDSIDVEGAVSNLPRSGDVEGNYQLDLLLANKDGFINSSVYKINEKVAPKGNAKTPTIAIIDTGVNYDYFPKPFLLNTSNKNNCNKEVSGWDFVNGDRDIRDDHQYGHGTLVTKIITSELEKVGLDYRILALRAFNKKGEGSYWNLVCAMNYLKTKVVPVDIVNMSFGWYDIKGQTILESMIKSMDKTLFVASAGNAGVNVDGEDAHFPSGYDLDNIIAVGGYESTGNIVINSSNEILEGINVAEYSNYGTKSIDAVAPYEDFHLVLQEPGGADIIATPAGTSFSAAFVTARAAAYVNNEFLSPVFTKQHMLESSYFSDIILESTTTGRVFLPNK